MVGYSCHHLGWWCLQKPPLRIPGQGFYLGERKLAVPTCRDEVAEIVEELGSGGGEHGFTVDDVHTAMVAGGSSWSRETVAKTMLRMTLPVRRPPFVRLERAAINRYRVRQGGSVYTLLGVPVQGRVGSVGTADPRLPGSKSGDPSASLPSMPSASSPFR